MRNKFRMMLLSTATLGLFSCADKLTDDGLANGQLEDSQNYVYMNVSVALPTTSATRSGTDDNGGWDSEEGNDQTNSDENEQGNDDFEYGYAIENDVRSMLLVLTDADDDAYITHAVVSGITQSSEDVITERFKFTVGQKFSRKEINDAYDNGLLGTGNLGVNVYAFCNYTDDLLQKFENMTDDEKAGEWVNWTGTVIEGGSLPGAGPASQNSIWSSRSFVMSNAKIRTTEFPATKEEWDKYTSESSPFYLTSSQDPVKVERAAARLDFRDGSAGNNTYPLSIATKNGNSQYDINVIDVQLTRMALVNMSKNYNYLRRVSDDGMGKSTTNNWELAGIESPANYVVDTDYEEKSGGEISESNAGEYFNFPLFTDEKEYNMGAWYADDIETVLKGDVDTWSGSATNRYHIWRYVTENTIPAPIENQITVQSTGIIFKGSILPGKYINATMDGTNATEPTETSPYVPATDGEHRYISEKVEEALKAAAEHKDGSDYAYPKLYFLNGYLYAGLEDLVAVATSEGLSGQVYGVLNVILGHWVLVDKVFTYKESVEEGDTQLNADIYDEIINKIDHSLGYYEQNYTIDNELDEDNAKFKKLVTDQKITIYEASDESEFGVGDSGKGWGYYCYYFYWNRHNNNGNNSIMGPMEFATVRNNVYKLSVTKIGELGHPNDPENDPDPVDPNDPDEEDKVYMSVDVEVLPWVVRVNDIEF